MENTQKVMENQKFLDIMTNGIETNVSKYMNVFENDHGRFSITELVNFDNLENQVFKKVPFSTFDLESNIM